MTSVYCGASMCVCVCVCVCVCFCVCGREGGFFAGGLGMSLSLELKTSSLRREYQS